MIARLSTALAAALLVAACGADDGGRFDEQVAEVREAVEAGDREAATSSLEELRTTAFAAHAEGELGDEALFELTGLVDRAQAQLDDELPEPTTTTTEAPTTTAPPTTPPAPVFEADSEPDEGKDDKGDEGKGKGKGKNDDDGGDDDD